MIYVKFSFYETLVPQANPSCLYVKIAMIYV
jgi:hypothetical protein